MKKSLVNRVINGLILVTACIMFTGCGANLREFAENDLYIALQDRFRHNSDMLDRLHDLNLMSDDIYKQTSEDIAKRKQEFLQYENGEISKIVEIDEHGNLKNGGALTNKISAIWKYNKDSTYGIPEVITDDGNKIESTKNEPGSVPPTPIDLSNYVLSNYLCSSKANKLYDKYIVAINEESEVTDCSGSIIVISDSVQSDINERMDCTLYTLRPDIASIGVQDGINTDTIDGIFAMLNKYINDADGINDSALANYFKAATYSSDVTINGKTHKKGETIKLLDLTAAGDQGFRLVKTSTYIKGTSYDNQPGKDLIIRQYNKPVLKIKFSEFDMDEFNRLMALIGSGNNRYVFSVGSENRCYLMEYPVYYISALSTDNSDNRFENAELQESALSINLLTKQIFKHEKSGSSYEIDGTLISNKDNLAYITLDGATGNNDTGKSAFILKGTAEVKLDSALIRSSVPVMATCGRIVLRDYLEATYAPGFVAGEPLVIFGRKLRFENMRWVKSGEQYNLSFNKGDSIAGFVDINGNEITGAPKLYVEDFASVSSFNNAHEWLRKVLRPTALAEAPFTIPGDTSETKTIKGLPVDATNNRIAITSEFPGKYFGSVDAANSATKSNQLFYAVGTSTDMFKTNLFSSWVNSTDSNASLDWWNKWLADNNYYYSVSHEEVNGYLYNNYTYELTQSGIIVLDLETVAKIQHEYDLEDEIQTNRTIRTSFKVLGWLLIALSVILLLCWVVDTNMDFGIRLLEKITFGHWIAVKYDEDIPSLDTGGRRYMNLMKMSTSFIVIVTVGMLLIILDIFDIVVFLINMLGQVASQIGKMLQGI